MFKLSYSLHTVHDVIARLQAYLCKHLNRYVFHHYWVIPYPPPPNPSQSLPHLTKVKKLKKQVMGVVFTNQDKSTRVRMFT